MFGFTKRTRNVIKRIEYRKSSDCRTRYVPLSDLISDQNSDHEQKFRHKQEKGFLQYS